MKKNPNKRTAQKRKNSIQKLRKDLKVLEKDLAKIVGGVGNYY